MKIELKNVKVSEFASHETTCFEASVYVNGKRAFIASNQGMGGSNMYHAVNDKGKELLNQAFEYAKTLPDQEYMDFTVSMDLDILIDGLLQEYEKNKKLKQWCKTKTVFKMPDSPEGEYFTIKSKYNEKVKAYVQEKYPNAIIINEVL